MIKGNKIIIAVAVVAAGMTAEARVLEPGEALERAVQGDVAGSVANRVKSRAEVQTLVRTTLTAEKAEPAAYAFDLGSNGNGGFIIVSADDDARPLLGYSDRGSLDGDLPPALEWWLSEYAAQIEYMRTHSDPSRPVVKMSRAVEGRQAIEPLLKTRWDQGAPYNAKCPTYGKETTYTGCVATAMAQVMNYWRYPEYGTGSISYNAESVDRRLSMNFGNTTFDWDNMITAYNGNYTQEQADAVATLMKACGYAVKMDYGIDSSGALSMAVPYALKKYFGYDPNMLHELRAQYTATEWDAKMYENLRDCGPIMYGGGSMIGGGHSFVCDGYDGEGLYHFNWGWTGMSDGYFSLDALNPYALGAGGGGGGGYNFTQDAVFGIRPATGEPELDRPATLVQHGALGAEMKDGKLVFYLYAEHSPMWVSYNYVKKTFIFGAKVEKVDDPTFEPVMCDVNDKKFGLDAGYGTTPDYTEFSITPGELDLADGTYKVTMMVREADGERYVDIKPCAGYNTHVYLKKSGDKYTVDNDDCWVLNVLKGEVVGGLYYGLCAKFALTIENDGPYEQSRGFAPLLMDSEGNTLMMGESIFVSVKPGETVTREFVSTMYQLDQYFSVSADTEVILTFFDESTYNIWTDVMKKVTLHAMPGAPSMKLSMNPIVKNATYSLKDRAYVIKDPSNIEVESTLMLNNGVYGYETYACIKSLEGYDVYDYNGYSLYLDEQNPTANFSTVINFKEAVPGEKYGLMMGFVYGGYLYELDASHVTTIKISESAGVDDVTVDSDEDGEAEYYDLQGIRVDRPEAGRVYVKRAGGKASKVVM